MALSAATNAFASAINKNDLSAARNWLARAGAFDAPNGVVMALTKKLESLTAKPSGSQQATNTLTSSKGDDTTKLDTTLDTLEVMFRLKNPAPTIVGRDGKTPAKPLPLQKIDQNELTPYISLLEKMKIAAGTSEVQGKRIEGLIRKIRTWNED